ncbi:MAG: arginine--tRNA ligase [Candidatus Omnitrophica bacterium]|nr:arginine--tRNA ligase [Candidatus Omnitrophota bacterium]
MVKDIQELLIPIIKKAIINLGLNIEKKNILLEIPKDSRFGDLYTNVAMQLTKDINKPINEIARFLVEEIKRDLEDTPLKGYIKEVKVEGKGFINFYFSKIYFYEKIKDIFIKEKKALKKNIGLSKKVLIEFVSANPTGPLSVAHARQAVVGDSLANILAFLGFKVKREYYLNDEGRQIEILGKSVELKIKELEGQKITYPSDYYQGDYIYDIAKKLRENKIKIKNLSDYAVRYILRIIKKDLEDFGIRFDYWYSQKALRKSGKIKKALDFLRQRGFIYEKEGAIWFKSTDFGDDKDRVVVKSDGSYTYLAPDLAYHQDKYRRGFSWLINLWGPDHHGYINRLKAGVEALGKDPNSLSIIIIQLATLFKDGKPVEMSTRKGQYVTLREVMDEVGRDASRFFFLMRRTSSHLDFDLDAAKKQSPENPVYYIQYAHARICSILRQPDTDIKLKDIDLTLLTQKEEIELIKQLVRFDSVLSVCLDNLDPYPLTVFLKEVAEFFHRFYDRHRVLGVDVKLTKTRLALIKATQVVLACGLELLGLTCPEKM